MGSWRVFDREWAERLMSDRGGRARRECQFWVVRERERELGDNGGDGEKS